MALFKNKTKAPELNYLELIPFKIRESETNDGMINILIPKFKSQFFQNLIPKNKSKNFRVKLDALGSSVWESIDNKKKVSVIIDELSVLHGEKIQPAQERVIKFLTQLYQSNFINFKKLKKE
jgi:hypothetical protein